MGEVCVQRERLTLQVVNAVTHLLNGAGFGAKRVIVTELVPFDQLLDGALVILVGDLLKGAEVVPCFNQMRVNALCLLVHETWHLDAGQQSQAGQGDQQASQ